MQRLELSKTTYAFQSPVIRCWYVYEARRFIPALLMLVLKLYDHLLTMESEVKYIWPTPWSLGKCLYVATKYPALIDGAMQCYSKFLQLIAL